MAAGIPPAANMPTRFQMQPADFPRRQIITTAAFSRRCARADRARPEPARWPPARASARSTTRGGGARLQGDVQVGPFVHDHGAFEGEQPALFGNARADHGGIRHRRVLLLDEPFGQLHERRVFVGVVVVNDLLRRLLRVIRVLAVPQNVERLDGLNLAICDDAISRRRAAKPFCRTFNPPAPVAA